MNEQQLMQLQHDYQKSLQDESSQSNSRLYAPQLREQLAEAQAAVIAQTNPSKALKVILEGFRGNIINEYGKIEKIGNPIMNEYGIARVASMLIPFISDPIRFGNISEQEVRSLTLRIIDDVTVDIGIHWREYGIINPSAKDIIVDTLLGLIFITLTRSEEQGEKNFLSKVVLESLGSSTTKNRKKGNTSWLDRLKL